MDTSNNPGAHLLIKYINKNITPDELALLHKYMEESPVLKEMFEELSDPGNLWDRFWFQHDIDTNEEWQKFENKYLVEQTPTFSKVVPWRRIGYWAAAVAIPLILAASIIWFYNFKSRKPAVAKTQLDLNLMPDTSMAQYAPYAYMDLAGKGRFDLDSISEEGIDLTGLSILSQGTLLNIIYKGVDNKMPRTIYKIVTAEKPIKLQFPDSSRVTLNKRSSIIFPLPFDLHKRIVGFSGEAYFEVKSNPNVPFEVQLGNKSIVEAYGTSFNVTSYGQNSNTTLLCGRVVVTQNGQRRNLLEGEQLQIAEGNAAFMVTRADTKNAIAWTRKEFNYKNIGFKEMMLEVGRWYGYKVRFWGEMPLGKCSVILNEDVKLDDLLRSIKPAYEVEIKTSAENKIIDVIAKKYEKDESNDSGFKIQAAPFMP